MYIDSHLVHIFSGMWLSYPLALLSFCSGESAFPASELRHLLLLLLVVLGPLSSSLLCIKVFTDFSFCHRGWYGNSVPPQHWCLGVPTRSSRGLLSITVTTKISSHPSLMLKTIPSTKTGTWKKIFSSNWTMFRCARRPCHVDALFHASIHDHL